MDLVWWLLYALFAFGLYYIVGASKISLLWRIPLARVPGIGLWLVDLLECTACFGVWIGFFCGYLLGFGPSFAHSVLTRSFALACITASTNLLIAGHAAGFRYERN